MIKLALVVFAIGGMVIAAAKFASVANPGAVQALASSLEIDAEPTINPAALSRSAPIGLPQENWPIH